MLVIPRRVYLFHQAQGTIVVFIHEDGDVVGTAGGGYDNGVFGARDGVIGVMGGGDGARTGGEGGEGCSLDASYHCSGGYAACHVGIVGGGDGMGLHGGVVDVTLTDAA